MDRKLIDYLPLFVTDYKEIQEVMRVDEHEISEMWKLLEDLMNDQFVQGATDKGISIWESILNIIPKSTDTLDERRFRILVKLNEQLPFTFRSIYDQLCILCGVDGFKFIMDNDNYTITVKLALSNKNNYKDVSDYLRKVVPANMIIVISLLYNKHSTLSRFTHAQLSAYTHNDLKESVLNIKEEGV